MPQGMTSDGRSSPAARISVWRGAGRRAVGGMPRHQRTAERRLRAPAHAERRMPRWHLVASGRRAFFPGQSADAAILTPARITSAGARASFLAAWVRRALPPAWVRGAARPAEVTRACRLA
jgi:hypothetical protein